MENSRVEKRLGLVANDVVVLSNQVQPRHDRRVEDGFPSGAAREEGEDKVERREQQRVIRQILCQRETIAAPRIEVGEGQEVCNPNAGQQIPHLTVPVEHAFIFFLTSTEFGECPRVVELFFFPEPNYRI